jgi:FixJ family two-component response regulator
VSSETGSVTKPALVILVDDDDDVRSSLCSLFRLSGFEIACFSAAEEALASEQMRVATCVVSDIRMGGLSGLDLARTLRERGSPIPIILMTAFPHPGQQRVAAGYGVKAVLAKPFDPADLIACVTRAVGQEPS